MGAGLGGAGGVAVLGGSSTNSEKSFIGMIVAMWSLLWVVGGAKKGVPKGGAKKGCQTTLVAPPLWHPLRGVIPRKTGGVP